ncbi:hypothetical protein [Burkholderia pseudomallei]|uniref:hypothetical protein n=1 Tax=Burkholderia pseudomallei TaxID=28450 RepID=UPI000F140C2A|nr:hypothetical protein [Burkholderia pseudomallei]CAJ2943352.1 Uncharacterised protein [Burkholderia pseudomallei]CAJ3318210.1 Uncharacterised protein [Burkholderia pseudomallei]VCJ15511.1 Uncharacterised protein [Burkholderia pseudomallei]VCJ24280.1 Uncharacterised protein [Burkholderia pseudomallei]
MPFLDWINKNQAKDSSREVAYHLLKQEAVYGEQWEKSSGGRCLFLFAVAEDECGRSVFQQINDKLA